MPIEHTFLLRELDQSPYAEDGYYDELAQFNFIYPRDERFFCSERNAFVIGGTGFDGNLYVLQLNDPAIYAHMYIGQEQPLPRAII